MSPSGGGGCVPSGRRGRTAATPLQRNPIQPAKTSSVRDEPIVSLGLRTDGRLGVRLGITRQRVDDGPLRGQNRSSLCRAAVARSAGTDPGKECRWRFLTSKGGRRSWPRPKSSIRASRNVRRRAKAAGKRRPSPATRGGFPRPTGPDPVALLEEQNLTREQDLVPVRHGRMLVSPFTFYRGAAKIMAADLKDTPRAGLVSQLCGDAHLSNFGVVRLTGADPAVRSQRLRRDTSGPVRVRRQADGRELHDRGAEQRVHQGGNARRDAHRRSGLPRSDGRVRADAHPGHLVRPPVRGTADGNHGAWPWQRKRARPSRRQPRAWKRRRRQNVAKAHTRDSLQALSKLAERVDGKYRIVSQPPIVIPARELGESFGMSADEIQHAVREQLRSYRATLPDDRRHLLERFEVIDVARKVVGVGSVGTRAFIALLQGRDQAGSAVPAGQGGHEVGARGPLAEEPVQAAGRARGAGPADDAGRERHLPGVDQGRAGQPVPVLAATARHEGLSHRRRR